MSYRFHLLGLAHVPTRKDVSACAYTQKVFKLAQMLKSLGHEVIFYGGEGSEVECDEFVPVVSAKTRRATYGDYNWNTEFFKHDPYDPAHAEFNANAIAGINTRKQARDFLLCPMGNYDKPVADAVGLMTVESGIGYEGVFCDKRVFESYAWMHHVYGLLRQANGSWYDAVIPNYFDPADFTYCETKQDYYLYVGRLTQRKGLDIAVQVTKAIGAKLIVAGQGSLVNTQERLDIREPHVEHVGSVGPEERSRLMGGARAVFCPTYYLEPFGGVAVESQLCGTPVISSDWGAFTETVLHGVTGYRCRTFEQFVWAARHASELSPAACRRWAEDNYSLARVAEMYQEYFDQLYALWGAGWYAQNEGRTALDWLRKMYPGVE